MLLIFECEGRGRNGSKQRTSASGQLETDIFKKKTGVGGGKGRCYIPECFLGKAGQMKGQE